MENLKSLSDDELRARLERFAVSERRIAATLLWHLAEYDRRKLYKEDGHKSMWTYCVKVMKFAPAEVKLRLQAARAIAGNEKLFRMLESGESRWLEVDHVVPAALGGATALGDLRTLCRADNRVQAEEVFGAAYVAAAIAAKAARRATA